MDIRKKNLLLGLLVGAIAFAFFAGSILMVLYSK
jgi:hypothetical protein